MTDVAREDDGWQEPADVSDFNWGDDDPDGGVLVPANPRPRSGAPAQALAVPVG